MDDGDDFFGVQDTDGSSIDPSNSTRKLSQKLYNDGYRFGKTSEEERAIQENFDISFRVGMHVGRLCGVLYGKLKVLTVDKDVLDYISNDFPEAYCLDKARSVTKIREKLGSIFVDKPECSTILSDFLEQLEDVSSLPCVTSV